VLSDTEFSDIIAELESLRFGDWNVGMGVQYDPNDTRSEKGDVQLQYKPAYRPRRERRLSLPPRQHRAGRRLGCLADRKDWSAYARLVYSLEDQKSLDQFAGLEYRSCCWRSAP
jgi:LPS-assembly protein